MPGNSPVILASVFVFVALGVVLAIVFAPKKPPAPPPSKIAYQARPDNIEPPDDLEAPESSRGPRRARAEETPAPAVEASEGRYPVYGCVTDVKTGKPISKALVTCDPVGKPGNVVEPAAQPDSQRDRRPRGRRAAQDREKPRDPRYKTYTNEEGKYSVRVADPGEYQFQVARNGYVRIKDERGTLEAGRGELRMDFALSTGAAISGRVIESGTSRGASRVRLRTSGAANSAAQTDQEGKYRLSGLVPGEYVVMLDLRKAPYLASGMVPSRNVVIKTETQEVTGVDFTVDVAGEVWGYILTREGDPISGADVVLCTTSSMFSQLAEASIKRTPPPGGRSSQEGYYDIVGVPLNKEWRLYATTEQRAPQLTAPFLLTSSQRTVRVDIYVSPGTTVYGRVVSTDRTPVAKAEVVCIPSYSKFFSAFDTPRAFRRIASNEDGTFQIPHLPVGEYQVLANKKGFKFAATGEPIYPDGYSDIRNVEVVLTPSESGQFAVYGTVTDAGGAPVDGVRLTLGSMGADDVRGDSRDATTDANGNYTFEGVQSGFLLLVAEKEGYQGQNVSNVKLNEPTNVVMQASAMVSGNVVIQETNAPPERFTVQAIRTAGPARGGPGLGPMLNNAIGRSFTSADGGFTIEVAPGDYTIEARAMGLTPGRVQVSVDPGQHLDGVTIYVRQAGGRIQGRVVTSDGKSPQGALVWMVQGGAPATPIAMTAGGEQSGLQVGADGVFEFSSLPAGTYILQARLEGYAQGQSAPVQLTEGQTSSGIQIVLGPGNALQGYVAFNGRMTSGAIVQVFGVENGVSETTTSDQDGNYHIEKLPPGRYFASAISLSGGPVLGLASLLHAWVDIVEGSTTTHNFGEPTNTALIGLCTPPPSAGTIAYAFLHLPGMPFDPSMINVANPLSWFEAGSALADSQVSPALIDRDGYFRMDDLAPGQFVLDILYAEIGGLVSGRARHVYSGPVTITAGQVTQMDVQIQRP
jgi:protocatechuate 3,4-dioxygenase beta subunit